MIVEERITIDGPRSAVWAALAGIENAAEIFGGIEKIEVLEKPAHGLAGMRWLETRILFGEPATVEKRITDASENDFYTTRAESEGFVFLTTQRISGNDGRIVVSSSHESRPVSFGARLQSIPMTLFFKGVLKKAILRDLNDVKAWIERK